MDHPYLLSEAQMRRIEPFFPLSHGIPRVDDRLIGIVSLTSDGRIILALSHFIPWQRTQHSTPPWRQHGSLALCFGRRGDAGC